MRRALWRFFNRESSPNAKPAAEHAHDSALAGRRTEPPTDDLAATRTRLERELDAHRQQRAHALQDDA